MLHAQPQRDGLSVMFRAAAMRAFAWLSASAMFAACGPPSSTDDSGRTDATTMHDALVDGSIDVAFACAPPCGAGFTCDLATRTCVATSLDGGPNDTGPLDDVHTEGCVPDCQRRICGDDGCGGSCGTCPSGQGCVNGLCQAACVPEPDATMCARLHKNCDSLTAMDNCGNVRTANCGVCSAPQSCGGAGQPNVCGSPAGNCSGRICGSDGAGGSCGSCPLHATCNADQASCGCDNGYAPSADGLACLAIGQACPANSPADYCVAGQYWVICDPRWGLQYLDCGVGQCGQNANGVGHGSCSCGSNGTTFPSLGTAGACAQPTWSNLAGEDNFICAAGRTYFFNCRALTQRESGRCWTLVSEFGYQSACQCDQCVRYYNNQCVPACGGGGACVTVDAASRSYTCQ